VAKSNTARITRAEPERPVKIKAQPGAADLDRLIHERVRLAIVSALAVRESLTFNELKALSRRATATSVSTRASSRTPSTSRATSRSRAAFPKPNTDSRLRRRALERYLDHMEALIRATRAR